MSVQSIGKAKAFEPGSDLWIAPQAESSELTKELNWYSGFLMSSGNYRKPPELSAELLSFLKENELEFLKKNPETPERTLVATDHVLPNRLLLILPYKKNLKEWLHQAHEVWQGLGRPTLRFFLPKEVDADQFSKAWPEKGIGQQVTLVGL